MTISLALAVARGAAARNGCEQQADERPRPVVTNLMGAQRDAQLPMAVLESVNGGRHWTRTSDVLHVKRFRLSAVMRAWSVERNRRSYEVAAPDVIDG